MRAKRPAPPVIPGDLQAPEVAPPIEDDADWTGMDLAGAECAGVVASGWAVARAVLRRCRFTGARLDQPAFTDVRLVGCDLAGADLRRASLVRVEFVDCRLTSTSLAGASLRDVVLRDCVATDLNLRQAEGQRVALDGGDFTRADLQRVSIPGLHCEGTRLVDVEWAGAELRGATFERCDMSGGRGLSGLRGATLELGELINLAPRLAAELGIHTRVITDDGQ